MTGVAVAVVVVVVVDGDVLLLVLVDPAVVKEAKGGGPLL